MSRLTWDNTAEHFFETGIEKMVLYPYDKESNKYTNGVAWNGVSSVSETPSGAEATKVYADNQVYLTLISAEEFGATIEAYTYPDEFAILDGSAEPLKGVHIGQQSRGTFGLCYRTKIGNDIDGQDHSEKIHCVYGCKATPSEHQYQTVNDSPEAATMSWTINTTPVPVTGYKPTSIVTIDLRDFADQAGKAKIKDLEDKLYGTDASQGAEATVAELPLPDKIFEILGLTNGGNG